MPNLNPTLPENQPPSLTFVLVNYNGLDDTLECVQSIRKASDTAKIIVVDNASENFSKDAIREIDPTSIIIENCNNLGWAGGNNSGIRRALEFNSDWICLLNNDTVISPEFVQCHENVVAQNTDIKLYGPLIYDFKNRDKLQTAACFFNRNGQNTFMSDVPIDANHTQLELHDTDIVNGCCMLIHRDLFQMVGDIDERFFLICEESDFCLRSRALGIHPKILARPLVWHKHSVSFERAGKPLQRYYGTRNLWLLLRKHRRRGTIGRGFTKSTIAFFRHAFHIFCHEIDLENPSGGQAVCNGLADAIFGNYGPQHKKNSLTSRIFFTLFSVTRTLFSRKKTLNAANHLRTASHS